MSRIASLTLMAFLCASGAWAQHRVAISGVTSRSGPPGVSAPGRSTSIGISGVVPFRAHPFGRGFGRGPFGGSPWPYLYPGYYDYADYYDSYQPPPPPPAPAAAVPAPQAKQEPLPDPVLLELQGNHWVRVSSFAMNPEQPAMPPQAAAASNALPPAVLVFRDGHSEEVSSYSIIGPVIYTKGDYWASGHWTRTIQIADLDIPQTLKQNQQRGVKFELPSGPDEVMIRP